jgi:hypothetical protein
MMKMNVDLGSGWKWIWLESINVQIRHYPRAEGKVKIISPEGRHLFKYWWNYTHYH